MLEGIKKKAQSIKFSILNFFEDNSGTILRTLIYTIGHFIIATLCVMYFTGTTIAIAMTDAIVEPLINGVWYFILDKFWASRMTNQNSTV